MKRDPEYMREIGKRGGQATLRNHGVDFLHAIAAKGGRASKHVKKTDRPKRIITKLEPPENSIVSSLDAILANLERPL